MGRKLATTIAVVMHPLLMPTTLFALLFYYVPGIAEPISKSAVPYILLAVFVTTFLLPMISMVALRLSVVVTHNKLVAALSIPERKDRILPFCFVSMFYAITTYMFFAKLRVNQALVIILVAVTVTILLVTVITLFVKVSVYSASAGSFVGFLIGLSIRAPQAQILIPMVCVMVLGGLLMSARLYVNEHKPGEVLIGYAAGLGVSLNAMLWFLN